MAIERYSFNQTDQIANKAPSAPPSFNVQLQIKAFKRDISFLKKIQNKLNTFLKGLNVESKQISSYIITKKISSIEKREEIDEYEPVSANETDENKPFKLDSAVKNDILKRLKDKDFSATQAKKIFNTKFKKCNSYEEIDSILFDVPDISIYEMGFSSETKMRQYLVDKVKYLVSLGYSDKQSKSAIVDAFNQALTKKEFDNYLNSIPKYEDYNKGYSNLKEILNIKKNATKKLLKQGYSKDDAEDIIEEYYIKTQSKDDFLYMIKQSPKPAIRFKGYETTEDYLKLQNACIDRLKAHLGYNHKKAAKIAKEYQKNYPSRTEFMFKINSIHRPIE